MSVIIETAEMMWWLGVGLYLPLACEASNQELAKQIMAESGFAVHQGDFMAEPAPPELARRLPFAIGARDERGYVAVEGGWENVMGHFIPVWGMSGIRVVEQSRIKVALHG